MRAFSIVELTVVLIMIGILATIAVPKYSAFVTRARQGEAKIQLEHIAALQEIYMLEHREYYNNTAMIVGYNGTTRCNETEDELHNKLGFSPPNCLELKYGYSIVNGSKTTFTAQAHAPSTIGSDKEIYPGCDGAGKGDKWTVSNKAKAVNTVNIITSCD